MLQPDRSTFLRCVLVAKWPNYNSSVRMAGSVSNILGQDKASKIMAIDPYRVYINPKVCKTTTT